MSSHKVLITGISGFVGSYLARQLLLTGNEVTGLLHRRSDDGQKPKRLKDIGVILKPNMHLVSGDITDLTSVLTAIQYAEPDWIFHLASQSDVPTSLKDPIGTFRVNCLGSLNILEAVRLKDIDCRIVFAGSSEEYGLQFIDNDHYEQAKKKYKVIEPAPREFPEIPSDEESYLRPMSPYGTSKVYGDHIFRNYHNTYGLETIVSRAFNHEGAGRGNNFVTSTIVRQLVSVHLEEQDIMKIGDIQTFRDWSHVEDIINGYILLAERANGGSVYVQGSMRTNSVLSYILYSVSLLGYEVNEIYSLEHQKRVKDPLEKSELKIGNVRLNNSNIVDKMFLTNQLKFNLCNKGIVIRTNKRDFKIQFDPLKFRPSEIPILLSNTNKIKMHFGFSIKRNLTDIINDQINYYLNPENRE